MDTTELRNDHLIDVIETELCHLDYKQGVAA